MAKNGFLRAARGVLAALVLSGAVALGGAVVSASAQTVVESSAETRFQLDFHVPDDALAALLPAGWTSAAATQGPAKDANMRVNFIDRVTINGPDGKPLGTGSSRVIWLTAPVKDPTGAAVQLVVSGLADNPADVPGPFGVYLLATTHKVRRTTSSGGGAAPIVDSQDWVFATATGEHVELHIQYERGVANRAPAADVKFYSAKNPSYYQISRQEQVLDILRNATTNPPDRVKSFSFKAGGGSYANFFPGSEKTLSWDNILWINRVVSLP